MKSQYKRYFLTTIGYFVGNVFTKLISFILLPLYTKLIDPAVYGVYGVNMTIVQLIVPVVYVAIWNAVFRFTSELNTNKEKYEIIATGLSVMWFSSAICTAIFLVIHIFWKLDSLFLVCLYAIANGFQYFYGYVARSMRDNKTFIMSGCINSTINLFLNWIGIVYFHHGIEVLYYSYIVGTIAQVLIIECKFRTLKYFKRSYVQKERLNKLIHFSGPLALNSIMQWLLTGLTQIVIAHMLGAYYNGLFSVAVKFATLISLIVSIFEFAWLELAYELAKRNNSALYYKKTINVLFSVLMFSGSVLMLMIKNIFPFFIAEAYQECLLVIPHIVFYASANAFASFSASIFMSYKAVNKLMVSSLIAGGMNLVFLIFLIPLFGFHGALSALAASSILMALIRSIVLHKKYKISLEISTLFSLIFIPVCGISFYATENFVIDIAVMIICIIVFLFVSYNFYFKYLKSKVN